MRWSVYIYIYSVYIYIVYICIHKIIIITIITIIIIMTIMMIIIIKGLPLPPTPWFSYGFSKPGAQRFFPSSDSWMLRFAIMVAMGPEKMKVRGPILVKHHNHHE